MHIKLNVQKFDNLTDAVIKLDEHSYKKKQRRLMKMIKFENTEVMGWEATIRGMRRTMEGLGLE